MAFLLPIILLFIFFSCVSLNQALLASNKENMTGKISYVCAFFRSKNYVIDDVAMPEILTFCSCAIIHSKWALTARLCYVQLDWYISPINTTFTNELPKNLHTIENITDVHELSLVKLKPDFTGEVIKLAEKILSATTICDLYGFSPPDNKPVQGSATNLLYKVWHMKGDLLKAKVEALYYKNCSDRFNNSLSEYKSVISGSTLCLNPLKNETLEPCSFDRGAPIICNGLLQGVLVYQRPHPKGIPLHVPNGCYGNINHAHSIYAESITTLSKLWIDKKIESIN